MERREIPVIYEDGSLIVIDKPAGLLTHPTRKDRTHGDVVSQLKARYGRIHPVHRLDRMTTGTLVLARTPTAATALANQFRDRKVEKHYLALVRGHTPRSGVIDRPLSTGEAFTERTGDAVEAITEFRTLAHATLGVPLGRYNEAWFSLVEARLRTGRTHQVRRHLARITHPVVGDKHHGDYAYNRYAEGVVGERYLFLRAHRLSITHPDGGTLSVEVDLPRQWLELLEALRLDSPKLAPRVSRSA